MADRPSSGELYAMMASSTPPRRALEEFARTNSGLPTYRPENPKYLQGRFNALGYTITDGPLKGTVVIMDTPHPHVPLSNTAAHEGYHQRVLQYGETPTDPLTGLAAARELARRMNTIQPPGEHAGPYWGMKPSRTADEQIANIKGYEGGLPRGTAITETLVGQQLLGGNQALKDYYFSQISHPYGGLWEGQTKPFDSGYSREAQQRKLAAQPLSIYDQLMRMLR